MVLIIAGRPFLFGDDLTSPPPLMAEDEPLNKHYSLKNVSEVAAPKDQVPESVDKSPAPQVLMAQEATEAAAESAKEYPNSGEFTSITFITFNPDLFQVQSLTHPQRLYHCMDLFRLPPPSL